MPEFKYYPVVFGEKVTAIKAFSKTAVRVTVITVIIAAVAAAVATVIVLMKRRAELGRAFPYRYWGRKRK